MSQGSENPQAPHPYINVYLRAEPFKLNNFVDRSWVDCCGEPGQKNIGGHAFYYSGARGGGVAYPDAFFFDLNGHVLEFVFDGPYRDGSTPTPETKKIEQTMLESFKSF